MALFSPAQKNPKSNKSTSFSEILYPFRLDHFKRMLYSMYINLAPSPNLFINSTFQCTDWPAPSANSVYDVITSMHQICIRLHQKLKCAAKILTWMRARACGVELQLTMFFFSSFFFVWMLFWLYLFIYLFFWPILKVYFLLCNCFFFKIIYYFYIELYMYCDRWMLSIFDDLSDMIVEMIF